LRRAAVHIREIETACDEWAEGGGYRIFPGESDEEGMAPVLVEQLMPLPDDLPVIVGEVFQCLRNSLDNLAFALALENNGGSLTEKEEEDVWFPIHRKTKVTRENRQLRLMSDSVKDEISALNPDPPTRPPKRNPLYLLNKAARRDKHSRILAAVGAASVFGFSARGPMMGMPTNAFVRIEVGADPVSLATIRMEGSPVRVSPIVQLRIQFDHAIPELDGKDVIKWLWLLYDQIRIVFGRLEPHLTP